MREILYDNLQRVVETFQDAVDPHYTDLPVCRFYHVISTPSLNADDLTLHKNHTYRVDLYTAKHDKNLVMTVENALFNTGLFLRITNISTSTENENIRTTFELSIEE